MKGFLDVLGIVKKLGGFKFLKLGPVVAMGYFVIVAGLEVACKILAGPWCGLAGAAREIGPIFGLSAPNFPVAELAAGIVGLLGVLNFARSMWAKAQTERAITDIIPPGPEGRNYEAEFMTVFLNDLGENTMLVAAKKGAELLALTKRMQAQGWNVSPPAVIAYIRQKKRLPKLAPQGLV
jgi:hypothetical protein